MRGAEALVLAFLAGALVRGWTLREFVRFRRDAPSSRCPHFRFVIATSCVDSCGSRRSRGTLYVVRDAGAGACDRTYLTLPGGFDMLFRAMLLLEGLALFLYGAHTHASIPVRRTARRRDRGGAARNRANHSMVRHR